MSEPLWTDTHIIAESEALGAYFDSQEVGLEARKLCQRIRDEMQRQIDALRAELAAANALTADARVIALERLVVGLRVASYGQLFEDTERDEMLLRQSGSHQ